MDVAASPSHAGAGDNVPAEWLFLTKYFAFLGEIGVIPSIVYRNPIDDIRIGKDTTTDDDDNDSWLQLNVSRSFLVNSNAPNSDEFSDGDDDSSSDDDDDDADSTWPTAPQVLERLSLLRDAIVLTSLVGKTDYDGWLVMMKTFAQFEIAPQYRQRRRDGRAVQRMPIQYEFRLDDEHNLDFLEWSSCLSRLLGISSRSAAYADDLDALKRELARRSVCWNEIAATPIKLEWCYFTSREDVSRRLLRIVDAVQHTQRIIEQDAREHNTSRGVLFHVTTMEAHMRDTPMRDCTVEALTSLLQLGVRFSRLYLPGIQDKGTDDQRPSLHLWCPFVRLLTGVDVDDDDRLASVEHIEMHGSYTGHLHFALFCSALACARGVQSFSLLCETRPNHFGWDPPDRRHVWRWLTFALFSRASSTSVKKLCIRGERPLPSDVAAIKSMVESSSPLHLLMDAAIGEHARVPHFPSDYSRSMTTIRRRAVFRVSDGMRMAECYSTRELSGELLSEASLAGERIAFIPGYGLCWGQLAERPQKRARTATVAARPMPSPSSSMEGLVLEPGDSKNYIPPQGFVGMLDAIGGQLRALQFKMEADDDTLARILSSCPNLESLCATEASLLSMDSFTKAYANGAKISSLKLYGVQVPEKALHDFVRELAASSTTKGSVAYTLERLHWEFVHDHPLRDETMRMFEHVLEQNTVITHLNGRYILPVHVNLAKYHGQRVPGLSRQQRNQVFAFLGSLRAVEHAGKLLDGCTKQLIWDFAIEPWYRHVHWFGTYRFRGN